MPGRLRSDGDDAGQDRRMLVEDYRDGGVVHVHEFLIRSGVSKDSTGVSPLRSQGETFSDAQSQNT